MALHISKKYIKMFIHKIYAVITMHASGRLEQ